MGKQQYETLITVKESQAMLIVTKTQLVNQSWPGHGDRGDRHHHQNDCHSNWSCSHHEDQAKV